jgi:hypothetical protein
MNIACSAAGLGSSVGAISGIESGATQPDRVPTAHSCGEVGGERVQLPPPD